MMVATATWFVAVELAGLVALIPIVWAIIDVVRRPPWQFPTGRKVLWVAILAGGVLIGLWPAALFSALLYLFVVRRQLPSVTPKPPMATWDPYGPAGGGRPPPLPPAGWYPDPSGIPGERWWDGRGWSEHTR
jgi:hypothetical protein